ncbi:MAG: hypothetical protein ACFFCP_11270 [Promethearchaeota archaeon]
MIISRKKWGKSAAKTERIIRDAIPKPEIMSGIDEHLQKAKSVTCYDLANRFNIRMSVARNILRDKEAEGIVVPYIREGGFVVYTTPAELEKREIGAPIMVADALEDVASSVPKEAVITEEMDVALLAAGTPGAIKPSKLTRKRREVGERKERKDIRPEVIVEPLERETPDEERDEIPVKKTPPTKKAPPTKKKEKEEAPKKKTTTKKKTSEKAKPEKKTPAKKKASTKKEEKLAPKKATTKKAEDKPAPMKKTTSKKKAAAKTKTEKKSAKKTTSKKATTEKEPVKKTTKKKE